MAKQAARAVRLFWDEHPLHCSLNAASLVINQATPDATTFCDDGPRVVVDNYGYSADFGGFSDFTEDELDQILHEGMATSHLFGLFPVSTGELPTEGSTCYEGLLVLSAPAKTWQTGNAAAFTANAVGNSGLTRGVTLRGASVTATGSGTGRNVGATTGQQVAVTFRVIGGTFTSLTLDVQQSSDNGVGDAYADVATLTSGSMTAPGAVRVVTTAATEAWKRVNVSAFSGTNAIVVVSIGVVAGT